MLSYFVAQNELDWRIIWASPAVAASDRLDSQTLACTNRNHAERRLVRQGFRKTCRKDQGEPGACRGKPAPEGLGMEDRR